MARFVLRAGLGSQLTCLRASPSLRHVRGDRERATPVPRSLVWATSLDVLPVDRRVERRDGYLAIRSPH